MAAISILLVLLFVFVVVAFDPSMRRHLIENPQLVISGLGIVVALLTFTYSQIAARQQSRKQHTIKILFDTRLSPEFRKFLDQRRAVRPAGTRISHAAFIEGLAWSDAEVGTDPQKQKQRDAVEAVRA